MSSLSCNYSLLNAENYKCLLENSLNDIINKYILIVSEYLRFIIENTKIKNIFYFNFILMRGLETITHVFKNILLNTKNLEMSYYHGQKAFYYYVEFIGQISEEQNQFLQLSSRDATMYVYKKTIFEIVSEHKKSSVSLDKELEVKLKGLKFHTQIHKSIIRFFLENKKNAECDTFIKKFEILADKMNSVVLLNEDLEAIEILIEFLSSKIISTDKYLNIISFLMKRVCKIKYLLKEKKINQKILDEQFNKMLDQSPECFINWVVS